MTAFFSTSVTPEGSETTIRGRDMGTDFNTLAMKYFIIILVASKSAITPSLTGLIVRMWPGFLLKTSTPSKPIPKTFRFLGLVSETITWLGSFRMIPFPRTAINVFAVPRSTYKSAPAPEDDPNSQLNIYYFLYPVALSNGKLMNAEIAENDRPKFRSNS